MRQKAVIFAALSLGCSPAALAQQASGETAVSAEPGLGDIVVTAQRRAENLQRVPIAVTALSSEQLETAMIKSTNDLVRVTPALTLYNSAGFVSPRIRGIGNSSAGPGVENSVAVYIDGVYISSSPGSVMSLSNVARVEVLKGPQGTLFGRNATGGLIQIVTKDPASEFGGEAHIGYGNFKTLTGDLYVTGPLGESTAMDLAVSAKHMGDGFGVNHLSGQEIYRIDRDLSVRSKIVSHIGADTIVKLSVDFSDQKGNDPAAVSKGGTTNGYWRTDPPESAPITLPHSGWDATEDGPIMRWVRTGGASLRVEHDFGGVALTSITAYRLLRVRQLIDSDYSPVAAGVLDYIQRDRQLTQELHLASTGNGPLRWMIGGYYFRLNAKYDPQTIALGTGAAQTFSIMKDYAFTESFSGFAQATLAITDNTNITGGFRYTTERRTLHGQRWVIGTDGVTAPGAAIPDQAATYRTPTWRLSIDHNLTPDVMLYASWNRGYKSGGFNAQNPNHPPYDPETLDAYELGLKGVSADRRLRMNMAAFYYDYRKIQVNAFIQSIARIYNAAAAELWGFDADFDFAVSDRLNINGGIVTLHSRFKNFDKATIATPLPNGLYSVAEGDASGNKLPFAPDATINLGMRYTLPMGDSSAVFAVNALHSTGYYTQPDNVVGQGAYNQINGSILFNIQDRYTVKAFINNILDEQIAVVHNVAATGTAISYQAPRTFGVELGVKF